MNTNKILTKSQRLNIIKEINSNNLSGEDIYPLRILLKDPNKRTIFEKLCLILTPDIDGYF